MVGIALADEQKARLAYTSEIDGENTTVAKLKADLEAGLFF